MTKETTTARIGEDFSKELEFVKDQRIKTKIDKKRKSTKRLTNLIVKHKFWKKIKEDLIEVDLEKK